MMNVTGSTKSMILNYMNDLTQNFDFTQVSHFTASSIAKEMHISRSLASQYLNELVKEKLVMIFFASSENGRIISFGISK